MELIALLMKKNNILISTFFLSKRNVVNFILFFSTMIIFTSCQQTMQQEDGMVLIAGGDFEMGGNNQQARQDEFPKHKVSISAFFIDKTEVTNAAFKLFVDATNYVTTAEKDFDFKDENGVVVHQKAGSLVFNPLKKGDVANPNTWWKFVEGANWKHPQGPHSTIEGKDNFPVVQVSWYDAEAYCKWANKRLPTEAEWEMAARCGLQNALYTFGNDRHGLFKKMNSWNGDFPYSNTALDGFERCAPVMSFPPNKNQLYDMAGNVWEWCSDWYDEKYYNKCVEFSNFKNPENKIANSALEKSMRGGSFLCNDSYCSGFRVSARMKSSAETSLEHTGFRCVKDVEQ